MEYQGSLIKALCIVFLIFQPLQASAAIISFEGEATVSTLDPNLSGTFALGDIINFSFDIDDSALNSAFGSVDSGTYVDGVQNLAITHANFGYNQSSTSVNIENNNKFEDQISISNPNDLNTSINLNAYFFQNFALNFINRGGNAFNDVLLTAEKFDLGLYLIASLDLHFNNPVLMDFASITANLTSLQQISQTPVPASIWFLTSALVLLSGLRSAAHDYKSDK